MLDAFHTWAITPRRRFSSKAPLGKAFQYSLSRWDALTRYVEDGRLSIDNNLSERLLRRVAITRKNFLFLGSDRGGDRAAAIYTIIESAKLNGLDPEAYLASALDRLSVTLGARIRITPSNGKASPGTSRPLPSAGQESLLAIR